MGKNVSYWAIQTCQNQGSISSYFSRKKHDYFLQYLGYCCQEKG